MKCKDIPDLPILLFLRDVSLNTSRRGTWFSGFNNSVNKAFPSDTPDKLVLAKMRQLIKKGLVEGCPCGCRGDFELSDKGKAAVVFLSDGKIRSNPPAKQGD